MTDFLEILNREADNTDHIYLYPEGEYWYAYEQSACRLKQIIWDCHIQKVINHTNEVVLICVQINRKQLDNELEERMYSRPDSHLPDGCFDIPVSTQSNIYFDMWKQTEFSREIACVEIRER